MIYRHYKGGLYYMIGYATLFPSQFSQSVSFEQVATARYTESPTEEVIVLIAMDENTGGTHFCFTSETLKDGVFCFYKDLKGDYWLRPREMFFSNVEIIDEHNNKHEMKRFELIKGELLFDAVADIFTDHVIEFDKS